MKRYRSTGNWAEDMGHDLEVFFKLAVVAFCLVPILMVTLVVVWFTK